ncbi:MAG: tetratricopeptide repeat protein [Acidobacteriales bacterium]|nr:tetratricopeptide repeat protein [Terriglobales bacterium]
MVSRAVNTSIVIIALSLVALSQSFGNNPAVDTFAGAAGRNFNSISGLVRTSEGRPAKDAHVAIHDRQTGQIVAYTYTNASGSFEIKVPRGIYEVVAQVGLEETRETVSAQTNDAMVSLRLPGAQPAEAGDRHSVSVAQMRVPDKARKAFKKAQEAMDKDKIEEAHKYVAQALESHADFSEALTLRGILRLDAHQLQEAVADFQRAIECDNNYATAYLALGAAFNALSQFDEALRVLDRGLGLSPTSWQGYFEKGKAFLGQANYEASIRQLIRAENMQPKYALIHLVKAHALLGMKSYPAAMTELELYLEQNPQGKDSAGARETLEKVRSFAAGK